MADEEEAARTLISIREHKSTMREGQYELFLSYWQMSNKLLIQFNDSNRLLMKDAKQSDLASLYSHIY
jgi:hypothetical protein